VSVTFDAEYAFEDALEPFPSWQKFSELDGLSLVSWDVHRGRSDEFQRTGTGTATVNLTDIEGVFGNDSPLPVHIRLSLRGSYVWRGFLQRRSAVVHPSGVVTNITLECADAFDLFGRTEISDELLFPGLSSVRVWGNIPDAQTAKNGDILYEDGQVDDRIIQVLEDAGWSDSLRSIFSGNVNVMESVYPPGTSVMQILSDAADAEFPDVANLFMGGARDLHGKVVFRGRFARFNPENYDIPTWLAGTGSHVTAGVAHIRELEWEDGTDQLFNTAFCYPDMIMYPRYYNDLSGAGDMQNQLFIDEDSTAQWGRKSWSSESIQTMRHNTNGDTGAEQCQLYAKYIKNNYAQPIPRVTRITLKSMLDDGNLAPANWDMMENAEIGDVVDLTTDWISGLYFIEGISASCAHGNGTIPDATVTYDLSPKAHWDVDPF